MNREQYIGALRFCYKAEAAGAIAGEVAMLLRGDPVQKRKLDVFRRLEASNKLLCAKALEHEGEARPTLDSSVCRAAYKVGFWWGEGDWASFLDRFQATVHPEVFQRYADQARQAADGYAGVDLALFEHLLRHERALLQFVTIEREGGDCALGLMSILDGELCAGLVSADEPVGW
jgi:hypothetical protein